MSRTRDVVERALFDTALKTIDRMRQDPGEMPFSACDNSCVICRPLGMGTNGGCRCDERQLRRAVMWYRARCVYLIECVKAAREGRDIERIQDMNGSPVSP